jgi:hypothetical protein
MSLESDDLIPDNDSDDVGGGEISAGAIGSIAAAAYPPVPTWNPFVDPTLYPPPLTIATTDANGNPITLSRLTFGWNSQTSSNAANTQQYVAYATPDNSQIVIGVEGTYNFSNLATDIAIWSSNGLVGQGFLDYLGDAAKFIHQVQQNNPNAQISLTGHSLGGAEAQILGAYFDLPTTVFDAPGTGVFIYSNSVQNTLSSYVPPGYNPQTDVSVSVNIARPGDLVSVVGTPFGTQGVITDTNPNSPINTQNHWWDALDDHYINPIVPYLNQTTNPNSGITVAPRQTSSDPYLRLPPNAVLGTPSSGTTIYQNSSVLSGALNILDPPEGSRFVISLSTFSYFLRPQLTTLLLPDDNLGIASFKVWTASNGQWSPQPTSYTLGTAISVDPNVQAIQFEAFNSSGQVQFIPGHYSFFGIFSISGSFSASMSAYNIYAHSDFTGGGVSDVLWRNSATGAWGFSDINNSLAWHDLGGSSTAYSVVGLGDLNGDGASDVVWRNNLSGAWGWSDVHNNLAWHDLGGSSTAYHVVGVGDFNGDGSSDVLWRNDTSGAWGWSDVHNNLAWHDLGSSLTAWNIVGVGDYNGDGASDALWRNDTTGAWAWSDIQNNKAWHDLGSSLTAYKVVA